MQDAEDADDLLLLAVETEVNGGGVAGEEGWICSIATTAVSMRA